MRAGQGIVRAKKWELKKTGFIVDHISQNLSSIASFKQ